MKQKLIVGNWKMNGSLAANAALLQAIKQGLPADNKAGVAVAAPAAYLAQVQAELAGAAIGVGAQDVSQHEQGAFTGEVSAAMLKEFGVRYALVGHSERRQYHGETDAVVASKAQAALAKGITPIVCVGETLEQREESGPTAVSVGQLEVALEGVPADADIVVAYEPVWAIGTGQVASPEQAQEVCAALRAVVADKLGADAAARTRILYGGSVKSGNIASFMREPDVDGALVGGASLVVDEFAAIIRFEKHVGV